FWQHTVSTAENSNDDFKHQALPLARIKKVMKSDPEVQMISSEVTILFEKACQIFIQELTARSHLVSLSNKRRTLSRPDVGEAIGKSDMFDFLIDIVPR
ncbi:histone-fold-containing protein, partial [Meredithblackwellia eburnea MCA 4105]